MYNNSSGTPVNIYNPTFERNQIISTKCNCNKVAFDSEEAKKTRRGPKKTRQKGLVSYARLSYAARCKKRKLLQGRRSIGAGDLSQILETELDRTG